MRRIRVRSRNIASIGYLSAERELEIEFRASGDVYRYFEVPSEEYAAFMAGRIEGDLFESGVQGSRVSLCCYLRGQEATGLSRQLQLFGSESPHQGTISSQWDQPSGPAGFIPAFGRA